MSSVVIPHEDIHRRLTHMASLSGPNRSAVEGLYRQWAVRYSAETQRTYRSNAQGGGDWAPLKPSTIARRRAGRGAKARQTIGGLRREALSQARRATTDRQGRSAVTKLKRAAKAAASVRILIDTGMLLNTLTLGAPGNLFRYIQDGVRFGVSGQAQHRSGKITLGRLATLHSTGAGNLPRREILVRPERMSNSTIIGMRRDVVALFAAINKKVRFQ